MHNFGGVAFLGAAMLLAADQVLATSTCESAPFCVVGGTYYGPGVGYASSGSSCSVPTCTCDPNGTGKGLCKSCPSGKSLTGACVVNGVTYKANQQYFPPNVACGEPTCRCDPNGSGKGLCTACPTSSVIKGACSSGGVVFSPGAKFRPACSTCADLTCTCDPKGTGKSNCVSCTKKNCVSGSSIYLPGTKYTPSSPACKNQTCTCDAGGSGKGKCTACPTPTPTAKNCVDPGNGKSYKPGDKYKPYGSTCDQNTCTCDPYGSGKANCVMCQTTTTTPKPTATPKNCVDAGNGKSYKPGDKYKPYGSTCDQTTCTCDPYGSGKANCVMCPMGATKQ